MPTLEVVMPALHPSQEAILDSKARFKVLDCGRRWGKSEFGSDQAVECALRGGAVWWVGPASREANIGWKKILPLAQQIPGTEIKVADREIYFPGGGWIAVLSAKSQTLRGEGLDLVIIDEAAYLYDLKQAWQEDLRAALSDHKGKAIFISTPDGRDFFYQLYLRGQSDDWPEWESWKLTSYENPYVEDSEIDAAKAELPEWVFNQEYLGEFVVFEGKVYKTFSPDCEAVFPGRALDLERYGEFWGGIDFGFTNPTVAAVGGLDGEDTLDVADGFYQTGLTGPQMVELVKQLHDRYRCRRWFCDDADPDSIAQLKAAGIPAVGVPKVSTASQPSSIKAGIIKVETRLVNGRLRICRDTTPPEFIEELDGYRYPDRREGAEVKEVPLKFKDHFPDALRYMVAGLDHLRGRVPRVRVAA